MINCPYPSDSMNCNNLEVWIVSRINFVFSCQCALTELFAVAWCPLCRRVIRRRCGQMNGTALPSSTNTRLCGSCGADLPWIGISRWPMSLPASRPTVADHDAAWPG